LTFPLDVIKHVARFCPEQTENFRCPLPSPPADNRLTTLNNWKKVYHNGVVAHKMDRVPAIGYSIHYSTILDYAPAIGYSIYYSTKLDYVPAIGYSIYSSTINTGSCSCYWLQYLLQYNK
jgi:hypothetical protein